MVACAGTQLFAQNAKEDIITFSLTEQGQTSVSTSPTALNAGNFSAPPQYYKTGTKKFATADLLHAIGYVLHGTPAYYSSKANLVLVQGELGGFFNLSEDLADTRSTYADNYTPDSATGFASTTVDQGGTFAALDTGRHFQENPLTFAWPPGHHQPWGQIFVKDPGKTGFGRTDALCEDVTFFFSIIVEECYDCFYLNSFITDAKFSFKSSNSGGPPCCTTPNNLLGSGKDRYYMSLSFDDTRNNPYLNPVNLFYVGNTDGPWPGILPADIKNPTPFPGDGITPDVIPYSDPIRSNLGSAGPYVMRFTLNGIVTYTWNLKFINNSDLFADFIGSASYSASGYGFIGLVCQLFTGTVGFAERSVKINTCCLDQPWYDSFWYPTGWNIFQDPWDDFSVNDPFGFESPINTAVDLTLHFGFDETYAPNKQSPSVSSTTYGTFGLVLPPQADEPQGTDDVDNQNAFVPTEYLPPCTDNVILTKTPSHKP